MSYYVEITRTITKSELLAALGEDDAFTISDQGENWVSFLLTQGTEQTLFNFERGHINVTSPSSDAWLKMEQLARKLDATVLGEEDDIPEPPPSQLSSPNIGRSMNINLGCGWLILCIILIILLIWKW